MKLRLLVTGSFGICLLTACPPDSSGTDSDTGATTTSATMTGTAGTTGTTEGPPTTGDMPTTGTTADGTTDSTTTDGTTTDGTTTDGDPALADCLAQYAELDKQIEKDCKCQVEMGLYPDVPTCLGDFAGFNAACQCPVLADDPANAAHFACIAAAEQAFTACTLPLACGDDEGFGECVIAYFEATETCGEPTKSSLGQVGLQCFDEPAFMCGGGEQIPDLYTCDAEPDCPDMSDEAMDVCSFMCGSGETIPKYSVCDEQVDCMDGSDEDPEMCLFDCGDGETIPKEWVCDSEADCQNGADEAMCP